ncbi:MULTISPECIES: Zn-ribbon domain-containing OB-fold protein [unclassified Sulfitobacter]|jgi:uncharacterized OB-fold protein|uniref:Zn-ribbon domain-containing OB-fold protein n=1 Tax=unclassified Sulfitobacter TaxID=196795 RepID=UPI0007C34C3E|nr:MULTISPECIES: OB-fold domain-containing protein [unclassified Sulfitobacter]KZX95968.1 hypothetical protein A3722_16400 [Sulfitobacter sp. HI0027]KZX98806.1 hypothetical protein A3720_14825 [Sulfitobacter sp. HI0021]KZZ03351.1 hypothetical protein A3747_12035 [Sulfitobacter sp. HI0076]|tara:strand:- start:156 stop:518 length:363 start_codon:yes stop_codon:yes gene_type:complete
MKDIFDQLAATYAKGFIRYQRCAACGHRQTFARPFCVACHTLGPEWRDADLGTVVACTVMHRAPTAEWKARLPYAIALVDLSDGPRVMALADPALTTGDRVALKPGGVHNLAYFEPMVTK